MLSNTISIVQLHMITSMLSMSFSYSLILLINDITVSVVTWSHAEVDSGGAAPHRLISASNCTHSGGSKADYHMLSD